MSDDNWRKEFDKEFVKEYPYGNSLDIKDRSKFEPVWNGNKPSPSTIKQFIKDLLARQSEEENEIGMKAISMLSKNQKLALFDWACMKYGESKCLVSWDKSKNTGGKE